MIKNVPILTFDQNQKIWSLDFTDHEKIPETTRVKKGSEPDKLTRFLQDYGSSEKSSAAFLIDQNMKQLKLQMRQKELMNRVNKIQEDNLFLLLKGHMEKSINQEASTIKTNQNVRMNLNE